MGSHCVHCMTEPPGTHTHAIAQISAAVTADAGDGSPLDDDTQWKLYVTTAGRADGDMRLTWIVATAAAHTQQVKAPPSSEKLLLPGVTLWGIKRSDSALFYFSWQLAEWGSRPFAHDSLTRIFLKTVCQQPAWKIRATVFQSYCCTPCSDNCNLAPSRCLIKQFNFMQQQEWYQNTLLFATQDLLLFAEVCVLVWVCVLCGCTWCTFVKVRRLHPCANLFPKSKKLTDSQSTDSTDTYVNPIL